MPHLVCLDKAGQYLLSLGTISHNPEKLFVMDFSGLGVWRHKPQPHKLVLIKLSSEKASLTSDLFTVMVLPSQCQKLTEIFSSQCPHVVKNSPPFSHLLQGLNF